MYLFFKQCLGTGKEKTQLPTNHTFKSRDRSAAYDRRCSQQHGLMDKKANHMVSLSKDFIFLSITLIKKDMQLGINVLRKYSGPSVSMGDWSVIRCGSGSSTTKNHRGARLFGGCWPPSHFRRLPGCNWKPLLFHNCEFRSHPGSVVRPGKVCGMDHGLSLASEHLAVVTEACRHTYARSYFR